MKKAAAILLMAMLAAPLFAARAFPLEERPPESAASYAEYIGTDKIIAMEAGEDVYVNLARTLFRAKEVVQHTVLSNMLEALRIGRIDAALLGHRYVRQLQDSGMYPDFDYLWVPKDVFINEAAPIFHTPELRDAYNEWFAGIAADGTWQEIVDRWIESPLPGQEDIPAFEFSGENGVLRACDTGNFPPLTYFDGNGKPAGFDVEMTSRFAQYMGMTPEFTMTNFAALVPAVISGKADMSAATFTITDERKEELLYGEPSVITQAVLVVLKDGGHAGLAGAEPKQPQNGGFAKWLTAGVVRNLLKDNRWKLIVDGLRVTLTIAFPSQIFGTVFGCFVCWMLTRKNRRIRWLGNFYCGLIHRMPVAVMLMIAYYIIFGKTGISNVTVAIAAFTMMLGAKVARDLKGAMEAVDAVEIEAARSMGFSAFGAFFMVTLPQAVRRALPGYANGFVELVKATSIVGVIAIQDLTRAGDIIRSRTYDVYFPLLLVTAIYLIMTTFFVQLFKLLVKPVNR